MMARVLAVLLLVFGLAAPATAAPKLERITTSGRVTLYAEPGLADIGTDLAQRADAALADISADLVGLPAPEHVELRLVRDSSDLARVAPPGRGAPPWAVGVAYPDVGIISVALRRGPHVLDPVFTLRHELGHLALGAALGDRAPRWLHEGFAYQHSPEYSRDRVETLAGMAWFGNVIPLADLDRSFPAEELPANRAYAQSYDFVGYLAKRGRWEDREDDGDRYPFRRFLRDLATGTHIDAAAIRAYGRPLDALFQEWKTDLARRYRLLPIGLLGFGLWILATLLLVFAWWRRRRQNKKRVDQWDADDEARRERERSQAVVAPPYIPWPGEADPLGEEPEEDKPTDPRLLN